MLRAEQLSMLGEFEGRRKPSQKLVELAARTSAMQNDIFMRPERIYIATLMNQDSRRMEASRSLLATAFWGGKLVAETAFGVAYFLPSLIALRHLEAKTEERILEEYPGAFPTDDRIEQFVGAPGPHLKNGLDSYIPSILERQGVEVAPCPGTQC